MFAPKKHLSDMCGLQVAVDGRYAMFGAAFAGEREPNGIDERSDHEASDDEDTQYAWAVGD